MEIKFRCKLIANFENLRLIEKINIINVYINDELWNVIEQIKTIPKL